MCLSMKDTIKDILVSNLGRQPALGLKPRNTGINQLSNYSYLRNLYRQAATTIGKIG